MKKKKQLVAFLRGINVGGHHKVPMAELKALMEKNGFSDSKSILNSGNIIFNYSLRAENAEVALEKLLLLHFKFPIPVIVREGEELLKSVQQEPFKKIKEEDHLHFYVSFLKDRNGKSKSDLVLDGLMVVSIQNDAVFFVLDKTKLQSTKGMEMLEKHFDKSLTTRNWNTIQKIAALLDSKS